MQKIIGERENVKSRDVRLDTVKRMQAITEHLEQCRKDNSFGYWSGEYFIDLGKRVRMERNSLRLSQEELGMLWGVTQAEVSNIELGNRKITVDQLFLLKMLEPSLDMNTLLGFYMTKRNRLDEEFRLLTKKLNTEGVEVVLKLLEAIRNSGSYIL